MTVTTAPAPASIDACAGNGNIAAPDTAASTP